jgi:hypothetical protein
MKLNPSIKIKQHNRLFNDKHRYKIVLISSFSYLFRWYSSSLDEVLTRIKFSIEHDGNSDKQDQYHFSEKLIAVLKTTEEYDMRVESPWISVYSNDSKFIKAISDINADFVKYVSMFNVPNAEKNTVYLKKIDHQFMVYLNRITDPQDSFVSWCEDNSKIKIGKRCLLNLSRGLISGCGEYFYVKDSKSLTMVRMFLGGKISKIINVKQRI